jgi:hypothetical protein
MYLILPTEKLVFTASDVATTIHQLTVQIATWYDQLRINLAHLDQPDSTPSVAQASSITTRTWSHYPPPYGTWYQHCR